MAHTRLTGIFATAAVVLATAGMAPAASAGPLKMAEATILGNDFESSYAPWAPRGSGVVLALTDAGARTGASSLEVSGRTANWQGAATNALALFTPGTAYQLSVWVKLAPGAAASSMALTVERKAGGDSFYDQVVSASATADGWTELAGSYMLPAGMDEATVYIEAADGAAVFLVDDVAIAGPPPAGAVEVLTSDFESSLAPWGPRGSDTVALTTDDAHSGAQSALVTDRTSSWNGIGTDVTSLFQSGTTYHVSAWVKLAAGASPDPADLRLSVQRDASDGTSAYDTVATVNDVTAAWVEVSADYTMVPAVSALLYVESTSELVPFLLDDVVITRHDTAIQTDIPSLKDVVPFHLGAAIDVRETSGPQSQLLTKHFDQITAENQLKPESIQPTEGTFTFDAADQLVDYAIANGLRVYGHTLVWHSQTPDWFFKDGDRDLTSSAADQAILLERMRTHIFTSAEHFQDKYGDTNPIWAFDVVNEAIDASQSDGLRHNRWYDVLGPDYLKHAFTFARDAFGPSVKLFLNDYNTELPEKREAMYDVVAGLIADGVPIDGIGNQFHLSLAQSVSQLDATLTRFSELGLLQAVTELDVTAYLSGAESWTIPPQERLIQQGYYYRDVFTVLRAHADQLSSVTLWGLYDSRTWLRSGSAPLLFDNDLQAKYAYWGIVDPTQLPVLTRTANVHAGDVPIDADAAAAREWTLLPLTTITSTEAGTTGFQVRWAADHLTAYVSVADATDDGAADTVELFTGDGSLAVGRDGGVTGSGTAAVTSTADGYVVVAALPLATTAAQGGMLPFDTRITDASGLVVSWNDPDNAQEDGARLGLLTLIEPVANVAIPQALVAPVADGVVDAQWADAPVVSTDIQVEGSPGATATIRLLWSEGALHLLAEVTDPQLDESSSNAWEQDSVEAFVDPGNDKAGAFGPEDGQYRVSFTNHQSISGETQVQDNLTSAAAITDTGYLIEASIAMDSTAVGDFVGLELQVNDATKAADAEAGARTSVRTWADPTGRSYQNTTRWGVGELVPTTFVPDPKIVLGTFVVRAGKALPVTLTGFWPGSQVEIRLESARGPHDPRPTSVLLATVTADAMGSASVQATVPERTSPGLYRVTAAVGDLSASARVAVMPAPPQWWSTPPRPPWWVHRP